MAQAASKGNCYLCGETISKTAFKKHLLEKHNDAAGDAQTCKLLKVEGADEKAYWLYLDMPVSATLKTIIGIVTPAISISWNVSLPNEIGRAHV